MVARINTGKSISKTLNYNEKKLQQGSAEILLAAGFFKSHQRLNFYEKLQRFKSYTSLNLRAVTNCLHVSLNFDPSEKLSNEKMEAIATTYMDRIGFGKQPYLVYRHHDSGHPHLHIVSTNIKLDGERISMHRMGANQSEKARKEIEIEFNLVKASSRTLTETAKLLPVQALKLSYGKSATKRAISNVLAVVLDQYRYSSLPELNALLQLYNIAAESGDSGSRIFANRGLVYRVLDENGKKIGSPVKASLFYMKPTLKMLEQKFAANEQLKNPFKKKLQTSVGWVLNQSPKGLDAFVKALEKETVTVVVRKGKGDVIYGLTYIDHKNKTVFNGSDLGKQFSAKAVLEKFGQDRMIKRDEKVSEVLAVVKDNFIQQHVQQFYWKLSPRLPEINVPFEPIPYPLRIKKKKRKKRGRNV
jgi:hypothetical protein